MKFDFKLPGKESAPAETKAAEAETPMENDGDETGEYTKADLGKLVASAVKMGDGEAIYEAIQKCMNSAPSDA